MSLLSAGAEAAPTASISGTVTSASEAKAIEHFEVCAAKLPSTEGAERCALTNPEGKYTLGELPSGEYRVEFSGYVCANEVQCAHEYVTQFYDAKAASAEANTLTLAEGETLSAINASMAQGGSISGSVTSDSIKKQPIENTLVCAVPQVAPLACAFTDASGNYTIGGLAPGLALVQFTGEVCSSATRTCTAVYTPQYYDEKTKLQEALPVPVSVGQTTPGINASLAEESPFRPINTEVPRLSGTPSVGSTLQCSQGEWAGNPTSLEYGWRANGAPLAGQTSSTYTVTSLDEGQAITCEVTARNGAGSASATSNALQLPAKIATARTTTATTSASPGATSQAKGIGTAAAAGVAQVKGVDAVITVHCAGAGGCQGTLRLFAKVSRKRTVRRHGRRVVLMRPRSVTIGTASFSIVAAGSETLHVRLTREGQLMVRRAGARGLEVTVTGSDIKAGALLLKNVHPARTHGGRAT